MRAREGTAARVSRNLSIAITEEMYHKGKISRDSAIARDSLVSFFRFDRATQSATIPRKIAQIVSSYEFLSKLSKRSEWILEQFQERTARVLSFYFILLLFVTPRIPAENRGAAVIVGHSKVSRFVLPIVGKRETRSSRGNVTSHCEIVSNVADLFLLRERRRICSREEESSIAFPQCS